MRSKSRLLLLPLALLLLLPVLHAQMSLDPTPQRGLLPAGAYAPGDIETVNAVSGNVMLRIPLATLPPGRAGHTYGLTYVYNSKLWDVDSIFRSYSLSGLTRNELVPARTKTGGGTAGWHFGWVYYLDLQERRVDAPTEDPCAQQYVERAKRIYRLRLITPDGAQHVMHPVGYTEWPSSRDGYYEVRPDGYVFRPGCMAQAPPLTGTVTYYSKDSTFLRLEVQNDGNIVEWENNPWTLYFPDGQRITWDTGGETIYDANNNRVDLRLTYFNGVLRWTIYDPFDRKIVFVPGPATTEGCVSRQDCIFATSTNGAEVVTKINYSTEVTVNKTYTCDDDPVLNPCSLVSYPLVLPVSLELPNGRSYSFGYNAGSPVNGYGELRSVTLPTGASATYTYARDGQSNLLWKDIINNAVTEKKHTYHEEYDGQYPEVNQTWHYTLTDTSSTVTGPDQGLTTYSFDSRENGSGLVNRIDLPHGGAVERIWAYNVPCNGSADSNPYVKTEFTSVPNAAAPPAPVKTAIQDFEYDKNGNVTRIDSYDWVNYSQVSRTNNVATAIPAAAVRKQQTLNTFYSPPLPPASDSSTDDSRVYHKTTSPALKNSLLATELRDVVGSNTTPVARTEFTYSTSGNVLQRKSWDSAKPLGTYSSPLTANNSISILHQYDSYGNRELTTDANGVQTRFLYGAIFPTQFDHLYVTEVDQAYTRPEQRRTLLDYDFSTGLVTYSTDVDNTITTKTSYDAFGRPTLLEEDWGGLDRQTAVEYSDVDRRVIVRSSLATSTDGKLVTVRHFDQLGRIRLERRLENTNQNATDETHGIKVQTRYGTATGASYLLVSNPYRADYSSGEGAGTMGWTRTVLDKAGRTTEVETFSTAAVPAWGSHTNSTGIVATGYNANETTVTDQANRKRRSIVDGLGRLTSIIEDPDGLAHSTTYAYTSDPLRSITTVTQGVQTRTSRSDSLGRLWSATNPESGTVTFGYDANGNATSRTDARNVTTTMAYDGLNRPTSRSYNDGSTPPVTYCYDGASTGACEGGPVPPGYRKGKLTFVKSASSSFAYNQFDGLGRVTQTTQTVPGVPSVTLDYAYNLAGGLTSERYSLLRTVTTTFDDASRVNGVAGYALNFGYTASGALQQFTLGSGLVEAAVFNSRMQPTNMTLTNPSNGVQLFGLAQEFAASTNSGNVLGQTITGPSLSITQKYGYDSLNRLSVAAENPASGTAICPDAGGSAWCEKYSYDRYGNRWIAPQDSSGLVQLAVTPTSESWFNPYFNPNDQGTWNRAETNRILGNGYDAAGNQTSAGTGTFAYDAENRQKSVTLLAPQSGTFSYSYDGDGFRVKRSVYGMESAYFHDAFGRVVTEYRNGNWLKDFVYLGGQLLAVEDSQGRFYVTADHLGSTRLVTEADKDVRSRHDYLPFGKEVPSDLGGRAGVLGYMVPGWSPTHRVNEPLLQRFTGQEVDPETGLEHFMFRYYSGRQGRFTSADPVSGDPSDPQSQNAYSYGLNNPLLYVDPLGLSTACYVDGVLSSCSTLSTLINMGAAFLSPLSPSTMIRWDRTSGTLQILAWAGEYTDSQGFMRDANGNLILDDGGDPVPLYQFTTTQGWRWVNTRASIDNTFLFVSDLAAGGGAAFYVPSLVNTATGAAAVVRTGSTAYWLGDLAGTAVRDALIAAVVPTYAALRMGKYGRLFGRAKGGPALLTRGRIRFGWYWTGTKDAIGLRIGTKKTGVHIPFYHP